MNQIRPAELAAMLNASPDAHPVVLDVRESWEVARCSLPGSVHIPMREIPVRFETLDPARTIVCLCHHGARSMQVAMFLAQRGYHHVLNLAGGIDAWSREVDPTTPTY